MPKIVVTNHQDFTPEQKSRLDALGDVTYYDSLPNGQEYLERVTGADIICSGTAGLQDVYSQLHDVYITVGFVSVAFVDLEVLKQHNVTVSNAPGVNRYAVSEWIIGMLINLSRQLPKFTNSTELFRKDGNLPPLTPGLARKNLCILGAGNIGKRVGEVATILDMNVSYFKRSDDLLDAIKAADYVVNTLSSNPSTKNLLDDIFFVGLKAGAYFVDVTRGEIVNHDALLQALENGTLAGVATDCGGILVGDTDDEIYKKYMSHPGVLATPHISYNTPLSMEMGNDVMIDNVEAWIAGEPINVVSAS